MHICVKSRNYNTFNNKHITCSVKRLVNLHYLTNTDQKKQGKQRSIFSRMPALSMAVKKKYTLRGMYISE